MIILFQIAIWLFIGMICIFWIGLVLGVTVGIPGYFLGAIAYTIAAPALSEEKKFAFRKVLHVEGEKFPSFYSAVCNFWCALVLIAYIIAISMTNTWGIVTKSILAMPYYSITGQEQPTLLEQIAKREVKQAEEERESGH